MFMHHSFTFIDLFSGIGGFRLGLEAAGGRCVFSSEIDPHARATYLANHATHHPFPEDIHAVQAASVPAHDLLVGGFPCQSFSIAGRKQGIKDMDRGNLFFDIVRLLAYHRPRAFLLENVKYLLHHQDGRTFQLMRMFLEDDLGYQMQWRVVDAQGFVPQRRKRLFMVGFREDNDFDLAALDIPRDSGRRLKHVLHRPREKVDVTPYTLSDRAWAGMQLHRARHKARGNGFGYRMVDPEGIFGTLTASYAGDGSAVLVPQRGKNPRRLTPRECARVMGFGDHFLLPETDSHAYQQLGNAVVPQVVEFLGGAMAPYLAPKMAQPAPATRPRAAVSAPLCASPQD